MSTFLQVLAEVIMQLFISEKKGMLPVCFENPEEVLTSAAALMYLDRIIQF
jgi:hypothetical protein